MIELHQIGINVPEDTEKWYIVRKLGDNLISQDFKHVPELSPSPGLFERYRQLVKNGQWNKETFQHIYVPVFLKETKTEPAVSLLKLLVRKSNRKNISLFCFCEDETICHRSIVGGILKGMNAEILCPDDYLQYYEMYKNSPSEC